MACTVAVVTTRSTTLVSLHWPAENVCVSVRGMRRVVTTVPSATTTHVRRSFTGRQRCSRLARHLPTLSLAPTT